MRLSLYNPQKGAGQRGALHFGVRDILRARALLNAAHKCYTYAILRVDGCMHTLWRREPGEAWQENEVVMLATREF
jgi:hypothetical protein